MLQTVFAGDEEFDQLVSGINNMASRVAGVMNTYSSQMKNEVRRILLPTILLLLLPPRGVYSPS